MNELILVLEENPEIQAVISASMKDSPIFINQELDPDYFLQQVQNLNPDLIFISNSDSESNYSTCRKIREDPAIKNIPVILLVNAKDEIDEDVLRELQINGMLRKPFEASMLKEQISQYISLDENFGAEPDKENDNFAFDISSIDSDLKEIKQQNQGQSQLDSHGADTLPDSVQKSQDKSYAVSAGSGPTNSNPSARSVSSTGAITLISSIPKCPSSPAWGFSPHTPRTGRMMPNRCSRSATTVRNTLSSRSGVTAPGTSVKGK